MSVVVPLFNEAECVFPLYSALVEACDALDTSYELIFVDDGSRDETLSILTRLHASDPRVVVICFRTNYGQTAAMTAGFRLARGRAVISMDGDLQNDPADIPRLLAKLDEGYDVACGWRKERKDRVLSRKIPSRSANWLLGKLTGLPIHDSGCSLRAYRATVVKHLVLYAELHRFVPAMSAITGARVAEVVVRHHPRRFGKSKYGIARVWRVSSDLLVVKMLTGFASRPALWFGILSLPSSCLGTLSLLSFLNPGTSGVVLAVTAFLCFSLSGHFLLLGVLGDLVLHTAHFGPDQVLAWETRRQVLSNASPTSTPRVDPD